MKRVVLLSTLIVAMAATACGSHSSFAKDPIPGAKEFLTNDHWNQGKAEYQVFALKDLPWYGKGRSSHDSYMITVKEPWDSKKNVKTSEENMDSAVVKFSRFEIFHTGTYPYSFKADMFLDVNTGEVVKYAMGSHDGCGNHFFRYDKHGKTGKFVWHSYWNDHGMIHATKDVTEFDTFFDALPIYLKFRLSEGSYTAKVIQPLIANRPIDITDAKNHLANQEDAMKRGVPSVVEVKVTNSKGHTVNGKKVIKTEVVHGDKTDVFYFEESFPHSLVKWEGTGERTVLLTKFFEYWVPDNRGKEAGYLFK